MKQKSRPMRRANSEPSITRPQLRIKTEEDAQERPRSESLTPEVKKRQRPIISSTTHRRRNLFAARYSRSPSVPRCRSSTVRSRSLSAASTSCSSLISQSTSGLRLSVPQNIIHRTSLLPSPLRLAPIVVSDDEEEDDEASASGPSTLPPSVKQHTAQTEYKTYGLELHFPDCHSMKVELTAAVGNVNRANGLATERMMAKALRRIVEVYNGRRS